MNNIEHLKESIQSYHRHQGAYPSVKISRRFWEEHANEVAELAAEGVDIRVVEELLNCSSYILGDLRQEGVGINTLADLKEQVDRWVAEGKGDWPVRQMLSGVDLYMPLRLYSIVPGQAPQEGLELQPGFPGAPEAEHILVVPGG